MYRCTVCKNVSEPRVPRYTYVVSRTRPNTVYKEIAAEITICAGCHDLLKRGVDYSYLLRCHGNIPRTPPAPVKRITQPSPVLIGEVVEDEGEVVIKVPSKISVNHTKKAPPKTK